MKGITFLQEHGLLSTPLDQGEVITFIKENPKLDKKQIGEFISNKKNGKILEAYQKYAGYFFNVSWFHLELINNTQVS